MQEAYCVELDKIITTREAWECLFGKNRIGKELSFRCPDKKCRATMVGVMLREYTNPSQASFKIHLKARHEPYCNFASKGSNLVEIVSPEQAKESLIIAMGYLYKYFSDRLQNIENKILNEKIRR